MHLRRTAAAALLVLTPAAAVACSSEDSASTTTTTTSTPPRNFSVSTPQGQVSLSLDGQLPPGWPDDFPLPDGAEPAGSGSLGGAGSTVRVGVFTTEGPGQDVLDFYTGDADLQTGEPSGIGSGQDLVGSVDLLSPFSGSVTVLSNSGTGYLVVTLREGGSTTTAPTTTAGGAPTTAATSG